MHSLTLIKGVENLTNNAKIVKTKFRAKMDTRWLKTILLIFAFSVLGLGTGRVFSHAWFVPKMVDFWPNRKIGRF